MRDQQINSILIIGMAGGLAKITTELLVKNYPESKIIGIDSRKCKNQISHPNVFYQTMPYSKSNLESLFRNHQVFGEHICSQK